MNVLVAQISQLHYKKPYLVRPSLLELGKLYWKDFLLWSSLLCGCSLLTIWLIPILYNSPSLFLVIIVSIIILCNLSLLLAIIFVIYNYFAVPNLLSINNNFLKTKELIKHCYINNDINLSQDIILHLDLKNKILNKDVTLFNQLNNKEQLLVINILKQIHSSKNYHEFINDLREHNKKTNLIKDSIITQLNDKFNEQNLFCRDYIKSKLFRIDFIKNNTFDIDTFQMQTHKYNVLIELCSSINCILDELILLKNENPNINWHFHLLKFKFSFLEKEKKLFNTANENSLTNLALLNDELLNLLKNIKEDLNKY